MGQDQATAATVTGAEKPAIAVTVVIPVLNERETLRPLVERLLPVLEGYGGYEVIFVNDGSTDGTGDEIDALCSEYSPEVKAIHFRINRGKAEALQTAFDLARGEIIVTMDGDLQDLPEELPKLIEPIRSGQVDAITGWKIDRKDPLSKTFPSRYFNLMVRRMSRLEIHDFNCGLKAFRRECVDCFRLYGQLHRFILVLIAASGYRVTEVPVVHAPRNFGVSKFGTRRIYHGLMDLLTIFFIVRYLHKPLHFFGFYGLISILLSGGLGTMYLGSHIHALITGTTAGLLNNKPLWVMAPILFMLGLIMIFFGLLGEMITYHVVHSQGSLQHVSSLVGIDPDEVARARKKGRQSLSSCPGATL